MKYYEEQGFLNDSIYECDAFIIVFKADVPVVDKWEGFHKKSIKQAEFVNFNHFKRTVIC